MGIRVNRLHSQGLNGHAQKLSAFLKFEILITNKDGELYNTIISKMISMHASILV